MSILKVEPNEKGTVIVTASFFNEEGTAVTPNTLTYTLIDKNEQVINSKEDEVLVPGKSVEVVLSGDDLPAGEQYFVIEGTYDSDAGTDLPIKGYAKYTVGHLPGS